MKICSHSTPKGTPACAKASKSYDWNVRNKAKIMPQMDKKQPFSTFLAFLKTCSHNLDKISFSIYTPHKSPICKMVSKLYDWDVRNITKISPKMAKQQPLLDFFDFLKDCPYDSNETYYSHSTINYSIICAMA